MIAEIVSVGTELLLGQTIDTDAAYLAQALSSVGISVYNRATVGDNIERLKDALKLALARADIVITIGGLGPTMDDLTKETLSEVIGIPLVEDENHTKWLIDFFTARGYPKLPESNLKQAFVPAVGGGIPNPNGTALGAIFETGKKIGICLPGPPNEFIPMVDQNVVPYLLDRTQGQRTVIKSRTLRIIDMGESLVEEQVKDLMDSSNPTVAPYAKLSEVHLRVTASAPDDKSAEALIAPRVEELQKRLGKTIYGYDDDTLETVVVNLLRKKGKHVAAAESCSGGLISKRITDIPDSSQIFDLGIVAYSNEAKERYLNVGHDILEKFGAVSAETARAMAHGIRITAKSDIGVSVTGIAGPSGGSAEKPVGTVYVGIAWESDKGPVAVAAHYMFLGRRGDISYRSSQMALTMVYQLLVDPDHKHFADVVLV